MSAASLRTGFTTGTCAAAAAQAAACWLFLGRETQTAAVRTPKGPVARLAVEKRLEEGRVWFAVQKDAGDDPDVTNRAWIWASIERLPEAEVRKEETDRMQWFSSERYPGLYLTGGRGIGRVTKPGLSCPPGSFAINPVPREMIFQAVGEIWEREARPFPCLIRIQIPEGEALAQKTFNPRLGIEGGLSVLGTSGIVEPMSEQALLDTIFLELHMKAAAGNREVILTPGNYGEQFVRDGLGLSLEQAVKCSNFIAEAIERAAGEGFRHVLFVGHIGKLIKVAGGVRNTHSRYGDRRMEILADCLDGAAGHGGGEKDPDVRTPERAEPEEAGRDCPEAGLSAERKSLRENILASNTTDEALGYLEAAGLREPVMKEVTARVCRQMNRWAGEKTRVDVVLFSGVYGLLGRSEGVRGHG